MKKNSFFKRRKKTEDLKTTKKNGETKTLDFYGNEMDDVQEYHNPYLTLGDFVDGKIEAKLLN